MSTSIKALTTLSIICFVLASNESDAVLRPEGASQFQLPKQNVKVTDDWFFVGTLETLVQSSYNPSLSTTVYAGQVFLFRTMFVPTNEKVKLNVLLYVPKSPERFPSHNGVVTIYPQKKAVSVQDDIDGSSGTTSFYWGIDEGDPKGEYELSFALNGNVVATYHFTVESK